MDRYVTYDIHTYYIGYIHVSRCVCEVRVCVCEYAKKLEWKVTVSQEENFLVGTGIILVEIGVDLPALSSSAWKL
jgi:hypothetical protein